MTEFVSLEVDNGVGTIRLNRPPMNALNRQVQEELLTCADEATRRDDVRAVIVYGGEKVFAAGADVKEMATMSYSDMAPVARRLSAGLGAVASIPKPTIAAVTGYALGGGLEVALSCDRRIVGDNAKLGVPEILLGVIPGGGGTQRLARLIGPSRAKDMVYTGRFVGAEEALAIGLVDEVVAPDEVYDRAVAYASQFANGPALAYAAAKRAIDGGLDTDLRTGLDIESDGFAGLFASEDRTIGMESFVENGPGKAKFIGR
ncbi:enoyl-CoA hydratase/isomerase family protein [Pseudonocardia bannensis]|uniref:enoyl-CoA hydratase n=1 Tax=Pseudonocardia bannensis TaxID=630973 RepID=A0A848DH26_9PSEU|nr:enoyl-CoA hydratase-related protein [Pseudonocardia bannensis]NMH91821.1 enoyl-CoA hydratase/isomerase family protein [Pseudonocardia bannensis]